MAARKPELMAPAGDWPSLRAAVQAGADAVYLGVRTLNMRATARNFEVGELPKVVSFCHEHDVHVYLTINTIIYETEIAAMESLLDDAKEADVDAIICWDAAVIEAARNRQIPVFLSTQASVSNSRAAAWYASRGVSRIVLARECTLEHLKSIRTRVDIGIEVFIHGAMCVSESGRCFMSQFLYGRSANRGDCLQPCRRAYRIIDPEEGHELDIENCYVMSPKDLCALPLLDKLLGIGVDSLKIEGRGRSPEYVKTVTKVYREAIDRYHEGTLDESMKKHLQERLSDVFNRGFSSGFLMGVPNDAWCDTYGSQAKTRKRFVGYVGNVYKKASAAEIRLEAGGMRQGDHVMVQGKTTGVHEQVAESLQVEHEPVREAAKGSRVGLRINGDIRPNDKVFVIEKIL